MKVCMFTNTYLPHVGGVARSVHRFTEDLREQGHDVLVVAPVFSEGDTIFQEENGVLRVPAIQNFNGSDFSVRIPVPFVLDQIIDEFAPEIIHSHHPFLLGDTAVRVAYKRRLPLIFTHHTLYEEYTHYVSSDSSVMRELAKNLATGYAELCTRVIAPSESIAELLGGRGVTVPVEVIPTGVDIKQFAKGDGRHIRQQYGIEEDTIVLGHLGRLAPEKNLKYLGQAVIEALKESSRPSVFLVVGTGPSEKTLKDLFVRAGCGDKLILAGKKQGPELADAYAAMDIFLFSSHSETQGMVLSEAMSASLPVIALNASGAREVVRDGKNGRLLPEETSPEDFATAVLQAIDDTGRRADWRQGAFSTAQDFSREASAERLIALYRRVLDQEKEMTSGEHHLAAFEEIVQAIRVEWELLAEKTSALLTSIQKELESE